MLNCQIDLMVKNNWNNNKGKYKRRNDNRHKGKGQAKVVETEVTPITYSKKKEEIKEATISILITVGNSEKIACQFTTATLQRKATTKWSTNSPYYWKCIP